MGVSGCVPHLGAMTAFAFIARIGSVSTSLAAPIDPVVSLPYVAIAGPPPDSSAPQSDGEA